ncbi:MAG: sensory rhodopsin transducer [Lentisphaeria bacterium]
MNDGAKTWYFPDGYLPEKTNNGSMEAHEALMLLNTTEQEAEVLIDIYFSDRNPVKDILLKVEAERVKTLRLDNPDDIGGLNIPALTQYSIRVRSNINIIAQFGRLDTTQNNMAYYGCIGYSE